MSLSNPAIDPLNGTSPPAGGNLGGIDGKGKLPTVNSPPPPPPTPTLPPIRTTQPTQRGQALPPATPPVNSPGLPPVSSPNLTTVSRGGPGTGVGSARGVFWKDEMPVAEEDAGEPAETLAVEREAPAWLVSLVLHLIFMLILALMSSPYGRNVTNIVLEMGAAKDEGDDFDSFELAAAQPDVAELLPEELEPVADEIVELPQQVFSPDSLLETMDPVQAQINSVAVPIAGMLSGRSGASKEALLAAFGGTAETENAVQLGLRWLAKQQLKDGSWSLRGPYDDGALSENNLAATAMALLAFQGNGNTHQQGPYRERVDRGARWLITKQDRSGMMGNGLPRHQKMYAQAQATIALCELYGMTRDSWLREPAQRAINFAAESQSRLGGWRYEPKQDADVSVTGWFVMALESGRAAGLDVNPSVLRDVDKFLDAVQHYGGAAYAYQIQSPPSKEMTAEGMLCRQYLGWKRDSPEMAKCVNSLVSDHIFNIEDQNFYYWYYATQVLHHYGGSPWRQWNERMREELPANQIKLGKEEGSWAPQRSRWGGQAGRLYTTCMAIYCLEVYYRHMPIYNIDLD